MSDPEDTPIPLTKIQEHVTTWPWSTARTYQLARDPGDGGPPLATIRVGKRRRMTTRRALSEFLAARVTTTTTPRQPLSPDQLAKRRATRAANKAIEAAQKP